jgi:hypothetical protein
MRCEGEACTTISISWDETVRAYVIRNNGSRPVRVQLRDWSGTTAVKVVAGQSVTVALTTFEDPYLATFCD